MLYFLVQNNRSKLEMFALEIHLEISVYSYIRFILKFNYTLIISEAAIQRGSGM